MRKGRLRTFALNVVTLAALGPLFTAVAPQLGRAQMQTAGEAGGAIDAGLLLPPAGLLNAGAIHGFGPFAWFTGEPKASSTLRGVWYSGYDAVKGAEYAFTGGTVALNGDLSRNGFFVRVYGSGVAYDLDVGDGRGYQADLMLGYRVSHGKVYGGLYLGADYQDYRLSPDDPTAEVRGTEWGFKVAADMATLREGTPIYYALTGNYSTAFETYWARARVGVNVHGITFGPEAVVMGNVGFDAQRVGGFVILDFRPPLEVTLHAGHQFVVGGEDAGTVGGVGGGDGTYGGIVFTLLF